MKELLIASGGQEPFCKKVPGPPKTFVYVEGPRRKALNRSFWGAFFQKGAKYIAPKRLSLFLIFLIFTILFIAAPIHAQERFPRPEFESDYKLPLTTTPAPRAEFFQVLDIIILAAALGLASYLALKKRSRRGIYSLMIFSLFYFGFLREGCVCSVGSIQNIAAALADSSFLLPVTAVAFFALPLIFALFFGRTFCAAVCPLGAAQDIVLQKPTRVPSWLSQVLGTLPYLYLGLAVLFAATGSGFIICRYDPFVGFFRFSAGFEMIVFGASFLLTSVFISRPYCRFLCPYGVLLNLMSRLSRRHVTITPDTCIQCRLCEDACPNGAIRVPTSGKISESRKKGIQRLAVLLLLLPLTMAAGGWAAAQLHGVTSRMHPTVQLAERVIMEDTGEAQETTLESRAFRSTGTPQSELFEKAISIRKQFYSGGWILGGFLGLVILLKLLGLSVRRTRIDYEPDPGSCLSCGRCFSYCPKEHTKEMSNGELE